MKQKGVFKSLLITAAIVIITNIICDLLLTLNVYEHISTVFAFAVFLISLLTDGYAYGIIAAFAGVLVINYAYTYPYYEVDFIEPANLISAVVMLTIAVLVGMLTTKLKEYEHTRVESEKERMRANLLRAVSHDIRTPLTTIYSASSALREKNDVLSEKQKDDMLRSIQEDSQWLIRMVENLLSITRIDSGRIKINKTPVILDELIDSVMTKFRSRYPDEKVNICIPDEIVVISIDAILIEQVIINILENSVQHAAGMTRIDLDVFTLGGQVVFEISDDGCGIPKDSMKDLFSGLYGAHHDNSDSSGRNAGIGLSVCDTIIRAHGGHITAKNRSSCGAVFRFSLEREENTYDE